MTSAQYSTSDHSRPVKIDGRVADVWDFTRNGTAIGTIIETPDGYRGELTPPHWFIGTELPFRQAVIDQLTRAAQSSTPPATEEP